jgi:hypothetical protein
MRASIAFALLSLVASSAFADPAADARAHSDAFARAMAVRDVAAVVALYADDAHVIWPGQEAKGRQSQLVTRSRERLQTAARARVAGRSLGNGMIAVFGQWKRDVKGPKGGETLHVRTSEVIRRSRPRRLDHASIGVPPAREP